MTRKRVSVRPQMSFTSAQKRSTFRSSSGASTSSSTQIGAGLVMNTANSSDNAVSACSPPESSDMTCSFLPGGLAWISRPALSGASDSLSRSLPLPPPHGLAILGRLFDQTLATDAALARLSHLGLGLSECLVGLGQTGLADRQPVGCLLAVRLGLVDLLAEHQPLLLDLLRLGSQFGDRG